MNKFEDIEMLEIPDDSDTASMSSESVTDTETPSSDGRSYAELKDWILTETPLEFQFNSAEYKQSIDQDDVFSLAHNKYVTSLYKLLESLTNDNVATNVYEQEEDEVIAVITTAPDIGQNKEVQHRNRRLADTFILVVDNLSEFIDSIKTVVDEDKLEHYYGLLSILDCIQANHFPSSTALKPELLTKWINRYDHKPENELVELVMINTPTPYKHPLFWNTYLSQMVTRGLLTEASDAIQSSKYDELQLQDPDLYNIILDVHTLLANYRSLSLKGQFAQWKLSACEFRDNFSALKEKVEEHNLEIAQNIYDLLCVVTGMPKSIAKRCTSWYEVFVALSLFHIRDDKNVFDDYFQMAVKEIPPPIFTEEDPEQDEEVFVLVEQAFINTMEGHYLKVLESISILDEPTAAYVSKLFEIKGLLLSYYTSLLRSSSGSFTYKTVSEYLLTKHAYENLNNHPLVPVGIGLLMNSDIMVSTKASANSKKVISEFLPKFFCKTNDDLEWALTLCAKLNLVSTAKKLYLKQGKKSLKEGYIHEALNMFVYCYDQDSFTEESSEGMSQVHDIVWNMIFQDSLINNRPIKDELINNIVTHKVDPDFEIHPIIRQCLSPYAVLVEFFNTVDSFRGSSDSIMKTFSKLVHLIRFNHLPKKFVPLLLAQMLPFFYRDYGKFQVPALIIITELIDNYETQVTKEELKEGDELYQYSIKNMEPSRSSYDWRIILEDEGVEIPENVDKLLKSLRLEIVARIGKVFIR